jgi:hypothetical protein
MRSSIPLRQRLLCSGHTIRRNAQTPMAKSGKRPKAGQEGAFDFSLATKRKQRARRSELALIDSENLRNEFQRVRDKIDWEALRHASTQDEVSAALSGVGQSSHDRLPNAAAILATVQDPKYPKLRPIRFLSESCALAIRNKPRKGDVYAPRYSRDICYQERRRRGQARKPVTDVEYWRAQAALGQRVPTRFVRSINKEEAKKRRRSADHVQDIGWTYTDIPEKMESVKKKRTTVWLPEATVVKLKQLSASTGAPMAELFRRAVEAYLKGGK